MHVVLGQVQVYAFKMELYYASTTLALVASIINMSNMPMRRCTENVYWWPGAVCRLVEPLLWSPCVL